MDVATFINNNILLFDGAMGTYFSSIYEDPFYKCEDANVTNPNVIKEIHNRYLIAGANAIKTNTFSLNSKEFSKKRIIEEGYKIAKCSAKTHNAFVFADIGYIQNQKNVDKFLEYKEIVDIFLDLGAENFIFETLADDIGIKEICEYIKSKTVSSFIIVSFASKADGFTTNGLLYTDLFHKYSNDKNINAVGFNCICGPTHLKNLIKTLDFNEKNVSIMPNSSYPTILDGRTAYVDNPKYYAEQMMEIVENSVKIIGGCCGTTPEFIGQIRILLENLNLSWQNKKIRNLKKEILFRENNFYKKAISGEKPIAVELDSPLIDDVSDFINNAKYLKERGCDLITIADCPVARARMDSSLLACKLKREYDINVMPHLTCRDRNINASKALLLGLSAEKINNVLLVTGDPITSTQRDEIKGVFQFNSKMFIEHIVKLNETLFSSPFYIYGALNLNSVNFDAQLKLAKEKVKNGAMGFFTQPIHSKRAVENLKKAKNELNVPIIAGILPIISYKNANFMNNEIPGISISEEIISKYEGKNKEECTKLAIDVSCEIINEISEFCDGYYLITLFGRVDIISEVISYIRN